MTRCNYRNLISDFFLEQLFRGNMSYFAQIGCATKSGTKGCSVHILICTCLGRDLFEMIMIFREVRGLKDLTSSIDRSKK